MSKIKWFHQVLKELLESKNITIKSFCQENNLNYMKILKVIKGDCLLKESCFNGIIGSKLFTQKEVENLRKSFQYMHLKNEDRQKIIGVENIFCSLYDTITEHRDSTNGYLERKEERVYDKISLQINDHIYKSYTGALKKAFIEGGSSFKIILFLPKIPGLIHEIYHTIKALMSCLDKRVTWRIECMLLMETGQKDCKETHMINLSKYIKLSTLSPNIRIRTLETGEKSKVKYGVYFQDRTLFFNNKGQDLILEYRDHQAVFASLMSRADDLFKTYYDGASFNTYLSNLMGERTYINSHHYGIRSYVSAISIGDTFKKTYSHDFKNKPVDHLDIYHKREAEALANKKIKMVQFICESGIESLLREGNLIDYSPCRELINGLSRLALIYDTLVETSKGYRLRLLQREFCKEYPFMRLIQFYEMHKKSNQWILARSKAPKGNFKKDNPFKNDIMYAIVVEDSSLVESFELFCKHFIGHKTLTTQASIDRIKKLAMSFYKDDPDLEIQSLLKKIEGFEMTCKKKV